MELDELDEEDVEVEVDCIYTVCWVCPKCHEHNSEYNIKPEQEIKCVCDKCGKEYSYCYSPY